jgi:hypothetical protein
MFKLELDARQAAVLYKILQAHRSDLQLEISDMDIEGLSEVLVEEENVVNQMLHELEALGLEHLIEANTGDYAG